MAHEGGWRHLACATLGAFLLQGEPSVCWVINDADVPSRVVLGRTVPDCYSMRASQSPLLARGSIISVIGENFELASGGSGVSVRVTVQGSTVDTAIVLVQPQRIRAIIPPDAPEGEGSLVVSHDGVSNAYPVRVVRRAFRLYHGSPQALAQNVSAAGEWQRNGFNTPARPGQPLVLWGTGLGPPDGGADEPVAFVGLQRARVLYAGPSGCCPGVDQIILETPSGVEGCTVPVILPDLEAQPNNAYATVAVAAGRGPCTDSNGMSQEVRTRMESDGHIRVGTVYVGGDGWYTAEGLTAIFYRFGTHHVFSAGTCGYPRWANGVFPDSQYWDAGTELTLSGPEGDRAVGRAPDHNSEIAGNLYVLDTNIARLPEGAYTLHNGSGGKNVGPFRITLPVSRAPVRFTNRETISPALDQDLTVTWSPAEAREGFVAISGTFLQFINSSNGYALGSFTCTESAATGRLTVPAWLMWTGSRRSAEVLEVSLRYVTRRQFTADGIDFGEILHRHEQESIRKPVTRGP